MPSYVARTLSSTKDGSQYGQYREAGYTPTMTVVTAASAEEARADAATLLGVAPSMVIVEPIK
jgi:hypothetical protein